MENEIWKDIKSYEGLYQISNFGRVRSLANEYCRKEKILKLQKHNDYYKAQLCSNRKMKRYFVHRLVADAFIPKIEDKKFVNHIDCNKSNNHYSNLEWVTSRENNLHYRKNMWLGGEVVITYVEKPWRVTIEKGNNSTIVGHFTTIDEAERAKLQMEQFI